MRFISPPPLRRRHGHRSYVDYAAIKHVRDRGMDHVVEREKHLKPLLALKDLIKSDPSKSLPITTITRSRDSLGVPFRPMDFVRRFPSVFEEFLPSGAAGGGFHPHIRLTPQVLDLDSDELLVYQTDTYKQDAANRLVRLLMISRADKIPLRVLDSVKWDLGLPHDYATSIVPEFPDHFRVIRDGAALELVCWSDQLAVSAVEKNAKGTPGAFPMQFAKDYEMDKKFKKWLDDWQKLPYVSPYENAVHLGPNSDESDKWVVGILHEVLNLFVSKKAERETLLGLGEWLGVRARVKRALLHHPGIFYLSSKTGTCTVLLKEAYKRGLLIEKNQVTEIRNQYMHLMKKVTVVSAPGDVRQQETEKVLESNGQGGNENGDDPAETDCDIDDSRDDCSDDVQECSTSDEDQKEIETTSRTRRKFKSSRPVNADRRGRGRDLDGDKRGRGKDLDADRRGRGGDLNADRTGRGRNLDADKRGRGRDIDADRKGREFDADRRGRGGDLDADRRGRGRDLDADRRGRGRDLDADRRGRGRDIDADRRGRGRSFESGRPSRNSERTIVSEKNHSKSADKGTRGNSSPWKMHAKDRNMLGRSTSDGRKPKLLTEKKSTTVI